MKDTIHIWPMEPVEENERILISAMIENKNELPFHLWFSLPSEEKENITNLCDPFAIATIFYGMKSGNEIMVHGQVSPALLRNLEEFQAVWTSWEPSRYKKIDIKATIEVEPKHYTPANNSIMAFSGGLDSCFTAFQHKKDFCGRLKCNITSAIMVHGFDIPLCDIEGFKRAFEKSKTILDDINVKLIPMATNFRDLKDHWSHSHAGGLGASLSLFQKNFENGVIAGSFSYNSLDLNIGWGSNPLTDLFLSSERFKIINDGSRYDRVEKLKYLCESWPFALDYLRVCWKGEQLDRNCCKCEKCIRNILCFYALGKKLPSCFKFDITLKQIENVIVPDLAVLFEYKCCLNAARSGGINEPWVKALERGIRKNEMRLNGKGLVWKKIKNKLAVRTRLKKLNSNLCGKGLEILEGAIK